MLKNAQMMMHNIMERNMNYKEAQVATEQFDKQHGSFFDRGRADSYYGRQRNPHRGGVGGESGPRIDAKTEAEFEAYHAGYEYNEEFGDRKSSD